MKKILLALATLIIAAIVIVVAVKSNKTNTTNTPSATNTTTNTSTNTADTGITPFPPKGGMPIRPTKDDLIAVNTPTAEQVIESPFTVSGEARGNWYFEASFPVQLLDGNGKEIATTTAKAQGDWMTTEYVPFEAVLTFAKPTTDIGTLVLKKDNPSGLPANDDQLRIPVRFVSNGELNTK